MLSSIQPRAMAGCKPAGQARAAAPFATMRLSQRMPMRMPMRRHAVAETSTAVAAKELDASAAPIAAGGDPWEDAKWQQYKWTVYRGVAYDLTSFIDKHPSGNWLINLGLGRDCTALFESYHLRPDVAVARLKTLPVLEGFPVDAVPRMPYPNDSEFYNTVRERVRKEVFKGSEVKGAHRTGSELAGAAVLGSAALAYALYTLDANWLTGTFLGLTGAWIGLTVQHCGNHGAMSTSPLVNKLMGMCDDLIGGSSLMWRYHHQVSHHIHCNDDILDEDVFSAFPFLRFDQRLPRSWFHRYQHIYMWATFPLLQFVFQFGDLKGLLENRTGGTTLYGADPFEKTTVILGKLTHYALIIGAPWVLHGAWAAATGAVAYSITQSIVLAATFAVSHNVSEVKPLDDNATRQSLKESLETRDWGVQQVLTSANWGGVIGNFFTGGLNLQIEHHLFPAISFMHYPAISAIVRDECNKRGVNYSHYDTLPQIIARFCKYMEEVGVAEQEPMSTHQSALARV